MTIAARDERLHAPNSEEPHRRFSRRTVAAGLLTATALVYAGRGRTRAQTSTPASGGSIATPEVADAANLLSLDDPLPLDAVQEVVPEITREIDTGPNVTVLGTPEASRAVTFGATDRPQRVVFCVDQYRSDDDAGRSFNAATEASKNVPGVTTESVSDLGEGALIGVVTRGIETHVGGGALFGNLNLNATLQFFDGTDENKEKVAELIRRQAEQAASELSTTELATPSS